MAGMERGVLHKKSAVKCSKMKGRESYELYESYLFNMRT